MAGLDEDEKHTVHNLDGIADPRVLDHKDSTDAIRRLDDAERGTNTVCTPSGDQPMVIINESCLYLLILISRKPEAVTSAPRAADRPYPPGIPHR